MPIEFIIGLSVIGIFALIVGFIILIVSIEGVARSGTSVADAVKELTKAVQQHEKGTRDIISETSFEARAAKEKPLSERVNESLAEGRVRRELKKVKKELRKILEKLGIEVPTP